MLFQTQLLSVNRSYLDPASIRAAVKLLEAGEVVALPTETVYGLAANALDPAAVARIFEAKERPWFDPLIVHLPSDDWLERVASVPDDLRPIVEKLTKKFWPGPLTIVLPKLAVIPDIVTAGLPRVAVRISADPVFQAVVGEFGLPLAAPSANRFGRISPTTGTHAFEELTGKIPMVLDAGPCQNGIESTIVEPRSDGSLAILREGPVTSGELAEYGRVQRPGVEAKTPMPGQLASHYAPETPFVLVDSGSEVQDPRRSGLLAWMADDQEAARFYCVEWLSKRHSLTDAAANLFAAMRRLDAAGCDVIYATRVPEEGIGRAIMERLERAAAPRHSASTHGLKS